MKKPIKIGSVWIGDDGYHVEVVGFHHLADGIQFLVVYRRVATSEWGACPYESWHRHFVRKDKSED